MIAPRTHAARPIEAGAYRPGQDNRCASCGGTHWHVGRITAECAACGEVMMLAASPLCFPPASKGVYHG